MKKLKMLIYGDPGVGKTTFCGTAVNVEELMPTVLFDFEGNTDSIESKCRFLTKIEELGSPVPGKIDVLNMITTERWSKNHLRPEAKPQYEFFQDACQFMYDGEHPYKTLIIDSLSDVDRMFVQYMLETFPIKRFDAELPEIKDYQKVNTAMLNMTYALKSMDLHIILTCKPYLEDKDEIIRPKLTGALRTEIPGLLKYSCPIISRNGKRVMYFQPWGQYAGKQCTEDALFGEKMEEPTLPKIFEILRKEN